jgi:methylated-DNA-protein-cysteine methyltransferase-like protein
MVGYAMNASHQLIPPIPAHRVVNRNGLLTGKHHFGGNSMQEILETEGFVIENDQIKDFEKHFWDPNVELVL